MNCGEVKTLIGQYLDSELDTRSTQAMREHLEQCASCAADWGAERRLDAALRARLKPPQKSAALWSEEERFVVEAFAQQAKAPVQPLTERHWAGSTLAIWREWLWPSPKYYLALAGLWMLLLALAPQEAEPSARASIPRVRPSAQIKMILAQQRQELKELLAAPEASASHSDEKSDLPRSERPGNSVFSLGGKAA